MDNNGQVMDSIRDNKGRFVAGHPRINNQPGHCGGHPKTIKGEVKDALKLAENAMPDIVKTLIFAAKQGNIAASIYLIDRIYGKPKQQTEVSGKLDFNDVTPNDLTDEQLMQIIVQGREGGTYRKESDALQRQGIREIGDQGKGKALQGDT